MLYKPSYGQIAAAGFRNHPQYRGCIGHWIMNENGGLTAYDCSGFRNNGILTNGPTWINGQFGSALNFDGVNNYVLIGDIPALNFERTNVFSGSAWIYLDTTIPIQTIIAKQDLTSPFRGWAFSVFHRATLDGTAIALILSNNGTTSYLEVNSGANTMSANRWFHVAFTYNGSSLAAGVKLYINGVVQTNTVFSDDLTTTIQTTIKASIGVRDPDSPGQYMDGIIDDVRIYNHALTPQAVLSLYNDPWAPWRIRQRRMFNASAEAERLVWRGSYAIFHQRGG